MTAQNEAKLIESAGNLFLAGVLALAKRLADCSETLLFEEAKNDCFTVVVRKAFDGFI
ncbi:hypothetical protein N9V84_06180 [Verrucomicrobiales bacterium]|nr:hypothetical protein [Verrucomicrobiales bacterium]